MQPLADEIFAALSEPCSHFTALHIEVRNSQDGDFLMSFGYLRGQEGIDGHLEPAGIPIAPHMLRHHCSAASVLDDDQPPVY